MSTPNAAAAGATPAAPAAPAAPAPSGRRRVDRLTVLNWLAFLAILAPVIGEGCAMQAARRRQEREAREACYAAASGVALALGTPPSRSPSPPTDDVTAPGCPR